jgi:hypothetical protein
MGKACIMHTGIRNVKKKEDYLGPLQIHGKLKFLTIKPGGTYSNHWFSEL